jgi:hypothetical protein
MNLLSNNTKQINHTIQVPPETQQVYLRRETLSTLRKLKNLKYSFLEGGILELNLSQGEK